MGRPSIALCMIVKNEEENLPRLFESIQGCFDEIHITDTGSTDKTVEIASKLGAKVHHFAWCNDFGAARNFSFSQATTDFIAWLDADDVLENREAFIQFRDHVMMLADYWIAPYHYASDAVTGKSLCTFSRERVIRRDRGMAWAYPIHEGVKPISNIPVRMDFTNSWCVRHKRTEADLLKDRSRNLSIFEHLRKTEKLDARMTYYYGKELFEAGKVIESIAEFQKAQAMPELELHDRILSYQYLCYAFMQCNQFERAIEAGHTGLMLAPTRAEFHSIIGDCYLKMGKLIEAKPFFEGAKGCSKMTGPGGASPIFFHEATYTDYPRNQIARICAQTGDLTGARKEAEECVEKFQSAEGKAILAEVVKLMDATVGYKGAIPCEDIVFTTPPQTAYEFDPGTYKTKATGGSETALIEMAHWIRKQSGRTVKVFNMREKPGTFDGVEYLPTNNVVEYMAKNKPFLHIAWRHNIKVTDAPTFVWSHDLITPGAENFDQYERIMCLTPFHKTYLMQRQGVPEHKIYVTRNGLAPSRFKSADVLLRDPFKFVFSSSPDRGLDRAMIVLDKVREKYPQVKLHVFYGIEHLPKWGHQALHDNLKRMFEERKDWVIYHGATEQQALMRHFKEAAYCVQPSDFIETSKITALEMACAGVYQVTRAVGGCVDTLRPIAEKGMATLVESDCITEGEFQVYVDATIKAMDEEAYKRVDVDAIQYAWAGVAQEWLRDLPVIAYGDQVA